MSKLGQYKYVRYQTLQRESSVLPFDESHETECFQHFGRQLRVGNEIDYVTACMLVNKWNCAAGHNHFFYVIC
jgi:hypothetical protein